MNIQCSGGSRSFAKETRALKIRSVVASHQKHPKLTATNWKPSSKLILLQLHKKLLKTSVSSFLQSFSMWCKLERWKSSVSGCLMSWQKIKKKRITVLKCHLLLFYTTMNHFSIGLWCATKRGFYTTTGDSGWTKKLQSFSQSQT